MAKTSGSDLLVRFEAGIVEAVEYFRLDKHFQSARVLQNVEREIETALKSIQDETERSRVQAGVESVYGRYGETKLIRQIEGEVLNVLELARSEEDWTLSYDGSSAKVWYRAERAENSSKSNGLHAFKARAELNAPVVNLCALLNETELFAELFWFVRKSAALQDLGRFRKSFHMQWQLLWPLSDREAPLLGYGVDGLDEDNCFMTVTRSLAREDVDSSGKQLEYPEPSSGRGQPVRMRAECLGFHFEPIEPTKTRATVVARLDLLLPFVPVALVNYSSRYFIRLSLHVLEVKAREMLGASPDSNKHLKAMEREDRREVYAWIQSRLEEHWKRHGKLEEFQNNKIESAQFKRTTSMENVDTSANGPPAAVDKKLALQLLKKR
mmetsp:Transcript_9446/g.19920  ORF Transcript_9446/g.19920 Transcript_9446/m.19920 type:complete len:382 (+) Transcript_9446:174-1319(+)